MQINEATNLLKITAPAIEKYLLINKWIRDFDFPNKNLMVFDLDNRRIAIPASEKFEDFHRNIEGILDMLAFYNNKSIKDIIYDIISSYTERLEFRVISKLSEDGKLPFGYAANCIEGLRDLILYSICAENKMQPICVRTTNFAKAELDNFKLAQTEVGSFIINVEASVGDEGKEQFTLDQCDINRPLEHKVVTRIYTAMKQINNVVSEDEKIDDLILDGYENGITANMCDALLKLKPEKGDIEIQTTIRYASSITRIIGDKKIISIKNKHFYVIEEIAKKYRENEKYSDTVLTGLINMLKNCNNDEQNEKSIALVTQIDGNLRSIKITLDDNDYKNACDAHRDERQVRVRGILDMSKRKWEMQQVDNFEVI